MSNEIVVTADPKGVFGEGVLKTATAKPGISLSLVAGQTKPTDGRYQLEPFSGGKMFPKIVIPDYLQGKTKDDQYAVNDWVFFYSPQLGDRIRVRLDSTAGAISVGTPLYIVSTTGEFKDLSGTSGDYVFEALEAVAGGAGGLCLAEYVGAA